MSISDFQLSPVPEHLGSHIAFSDRIAACWLGKSVGGTLGLPAEGKRERLSFSFYDPVPTLAPPNDDLELQLVWLDMVEKSEGRLTKADFSRAWLAHIHYMWDEYGWCRWNLRRGVPLASTGVFENHFQAGMGSPIRSEIWACLFPGDPQSAGHYAAMDASLDHGQEGIAGEVLFAVMQSVVATGGDLTHAITLALSFIPQDSETARAVQFILHSYQSGISEWNCWAALLDQHGNENFTHAPLNVALTLWALWYGGGDFEKSILLAVNGGYDTDCTAATVGATLGLLHGTKGIPLRWSEPIGESVFVGDGIRGLNTPQTLTELTNRILAQADKLESRKWEDSIWHPVLPSVDLAKLPGTIVLHPLHAAHSVPWANGELPPDVKQAAGATWTWHAPTDEFREIICLARHGARLFLDGKLVMECPAGLPYVPATHRSPDGSRIRIQPGAGTHDLRIELNTTDPQQEAALILAYPNLHICPWTKEELPHKAALPAV